MVRFPKIPQLEYIRPLRASKEDYEALAECYNSFNDPESWPTGFTGASVFTAEIVEGMYKGKDLNTQFVIEAPDDRKKIVGVCLLEKSWKSPDIWYVDLLGVAPDYQGKKLGKAALLKATEFVTKKGIRLLTLHTWGGNLKAMPLYKKQGYKWRPGTSVFMENYIPHILNFPLFKEFFEEFEWYEIFKPVINQEMDDEKEDDMFIYRYEFRHDKNNFLIVWIDRTIGRISGFHYAFRGKNFIVKLFTPSSFSYIGIDEFPIKLIIHNMSEKDLELELKEVEENNIELLSRAAQPLSVTLRQNEKSEMIFQAKIPKSAKELDLKNHPERYTKAYIKANVKLNTVDFTLFLGKLPIKPLETETPTVPFVLTHLTKEAIIPLNIYNYLGKDAEVVIILSTSEGMKLDHSKIRTVIPKYDNTINLHITLNENAKNIEWLKVEIYDIEGKKLHEKKLPIVLTELSNAISYNIDDKIIAENECVRVIFNKDPDVAYNIIEVIDKRKNIRVYGYEPAIGYPIKDLGNEFHTKRLEFESIKTAEGVIIAASAISDEKEGLKVIRKVFIPNVSAKIAIFYELQNTTTKAINNVAVVFDYESWRSLKDFKHSIYYLKDGLIKRDSYEVVPYLGNKPDLLKETWAAAVLANGVIGSIFSKDNIDTMRYRAVPRIVEKIGDIKAKERKTSSKFWLVFADDWHEVRNIWLTMQNKAHESIFPIPIERSIISLGIRDCNKSRPSIDRSRGVIIPKDHPVFEVYINSYKKAGIKEKVTLKLEDTLTEPSEWEFNTNAEEWKANCKITETKDKNLIRGEFKFLTGTRVYEFPIVIALYNSKANVIVRNEGEQKELWIIDNGFLRFKASRKFCGKLIEISSKKEQYQNNYLLSFYPELVPFIWWEKFYGGFGVVIYAENSEQSEKEFHKLEFEVEEVQINDWKGISFRTPIIEYNRKLKGLQLIVTYLTLPEAPFILVKTTIINHSNTMREFLLKTHCFVKTSNSKEDQYFVPTKSQLNRYYLYSHDTRIETDEKTKWMAAKNNNFKYILGYVHYPQNIKQKMSPRVYNYKALDLGVRWDKINIKAQDKIENIELLMLAENIGEIEPLQDIEIKVKN